MSDRIRVRRDELRNKLNVTGTDIKNLYKKFFLGNVPRQPISFLRNNHYLDYYMICQNQHKLFNKESELHLEKENSVQKEYLLASLIIVWKDIQCKLISTVCKLVMIFVVRIRFFGLWV